MKDRGRALTFTSAHVSRHTIGLLADPPPQRSYISETWEGARTEGGIMGEGWPLGRVWVQEAPGPIDLASPINRDVGQGWNPNSGAPGYTAEGTETAAVWGARDLVETENVADVRQARELVPDRFVRLLCEVVPAAGGKRG